MFSALKQPSNYFSLENQFFEFLATTMNSWLSGYSGITVVSHLILNN